MDSTSCSDTQARAYEEIGLGIREQFLDEGFAVVPQLIDMDEVGRLRATCRQYLTADTEAEMHATRILNHPDLASVAFRTKTIRILKGLLGDRLTIYPNMTARSARYTTWHVDNGFVPHFLSGDSKYLWLESFRHAQCVVYLQDNDRQTGGGLDIVPQTHGIDFDMGKGTSSLIASAMLSGSIKTRPLSIPSRAGDLVLFDGRLLHRGTPARKPAPRKKLGIFFSAARTDQSQIDSYMSYLAGRADQLIARGDAPAWMIDRYTDLRTVQFPDCFLPETVTLLQREQVHVPSFQPHHRAAATASATSSGRPDPS